MTRLSELFVPLLTRKVETISLTLSTLLGDVPTLRVKLADMVHNLTDNPSPKQKAKYASALNAIGQKTGGNAPQGISDNHWNTLMSLIEDRMSEEVWDKDDGEYQASVVKPVRMKEEEGLREKAVPRHSKAISVC